MKEDNDLLVNAQARRLRRSACSPAPRRFVKHGLALLVPRISWSVVGHAERVESVRNQAQHANGPRRRYQTL